MFNLTIRGEVAILRLDRPEVRNAIPLTGWAELGDRVEEATAAGVKAVILAGIPDGAFCAGADIADFGLFASDEDARARAFAWRSAPGSTGSAMRRSPRWP